MGFNESLKQENPIEEMTEDTVVSLAFDKEKLYKNMVDAKADWLVQPSGLGRRSLTRRPAKSFTGRRRR